MLRGQVALAIPLAPHPYALLATRSSSRLIGITPSFVTAWTFMPLKSMGNLLFSSSVHILRILMPWWRVISGW